MTRIASLVRNADDIEEEVVEVPQWGCSIGIRSMAGTARSQYLAELFEAADIEDRKERQAQLSRVECKLIVACTFDPEDPGTPAFEESDVEMLVSKSGAIIGALSNKCLRASGLDGKAEERLGKGFSVSARTASPAPVIPSDASTTTSAMNSEE
jgi:hypothetical protein